MGLLDKLFGKVKPAEIKEELPKVEKPKAERKPRKPREKKPKPESAVETKTEPSVKILKFDFDPQNPRLGSMELDWNTEFVDLLREHGYIGNTQEEIVDAWLMDVCRTISGEIPDMYNVRYIQRRDIGGGKTEFS